VKKNRKYKPTVQPVTSSFFREHSHRLPEAGEPMAYAMACVEVVANWSPRGRELYQELVNAWSAPGVKGFFEQFIANVPDDVVQEWKEKMRNPGLALSPDPNKPFDDLGKAGSSLGTVFGSEAVVRALEGAESTEEAADTARLFGLIFEFIIQGFNREKDLEQGIVRVLPTTEPPWLMLMALYRSGLEHGSITPDRLDRVYKVRQVKGKTVNFEEVMANEPMSRLHRKVVEASKKAGLKLHHDNTFLDAAWVWYQCRVVHATVEEFLKAEWDEGDYSVDLKNLQKLVKTCDDAVGYQKRLARPSR
jgi:hypothetical protein